MLGQRRLCLERRRTDVALEGRGDVRRHPVTLQRRRFGESLGANLTGQNVVGLRTVDRNQVI